MNEQDIPENVTAPTPDRVTPEEMAAKAAAECFKGTGIGADYHRKRAELIIREAIAAAFREAIAAAFREAIAAAFREREAEVDDLENRLSDLKVDAKAEIDWRDDALDHVRDRAARLEAANLALAKQVAELKQLEHDHPFTPDDSRGQKWCSVCYRSERFHVDLAALAAGGAQERETT